MIGFSDIFESGCTGQKALRMKNFLKDDISCRYATASEYYKVKESIKTMVKRCNNWYSGVELSVKITDPSAVNPGQVSILRGNNCTCILWLRVYYLSHWHQRGEKKEGGES